MQNNFNIFDNEIIHNVLTNTTTKRTGYKRKALYGADAGYCPRKNWFNANYPIEEKTEQLYLTFSQKIGNLIESEILTYFPNNLIAKSLRIPQSQDFANIDNSKINLTLMTNSLNYSGIIDAIFIDTNGNLSIIDIKTTGTISDDKYTKVDSEGNGLDKPQKAFVIEPNYVSQLTFYAAMTGINSASLLYISRLLNEKFGVNLSYKLESITITHESIYQTVYRAYFSQVCIENNVLPIIPLEFHRGKTRYCKYCDFKTNCYDGKYDELHVSAKDRSDLYDIAQTKTNEFMQIRNENYLLIRNFFGI